MLVDLLQCGLDLLPELPVLLQLLPVLLQHGQLDLLLVLLLHEDVQGLGCLVGLQELTVFLVLLLALGLCALLLLDGLEDVLLVSLFLLLLYASLELLVQLLLLSPLGLLFLLELLDFLPEFHLLLVDLPQFGLGFLGLGVVRLEVLGIVDGHILRQHTQVQVSNSDRLPLVLILPTLHPAPVDLGEQLLELLLGDPGYPLLHHLPHLHVPVPVLLHEAAVVLGDVEPVDSLLYFLGCLRDDLIQM